MRDVAVMAGGNNEMWQCGERSRRRSSLAYGALAFVMTAGVA